MGSHSMFKYCSFSEFSLSNLINDEIYLNHHEAFNDPFELGCKFHFGFPKKDPDCPRYQEVVRAWGFDDPSDLVALDMYDDYTSSLEGGEPWIPGVLDSARISCFSRRADNLLMWSHYADGMRGFCVEFDPDLLVSDSSEEATIFDVCYEREPAVVDASVIAVLNDQVDYLEGSIFNYKYRGGYFKGVDVVREIEAYQHKVDGDYGLKREIYQKMLATKPLEWAYEEEIRIIMHSAGEGNNGVFMRYPPAAVRSLIIGERMPLHHRRALAAVVEKHPHPIVVKIASRSDGEFKITMGPMRTP